MSAQIDAPKYTYLKRGVYYFVEVPKALWKLTIVRMQLRGWRFVCVMNVSLVLLLAEVGFDMKFSNLMIVAIATIMVESCLVMLQRSLHTTIVTFHVDERKPPSNI